MWVAFATHSFPAKIHVNEILYVLEQLTFLPLTSSLNYRCFEQQGSGHFLY